MPKCDIIDCENEGNNPLTPYINLCGLHWFNIMNRVMRLPEYLEEIENKRIQEGK